MIMGFTGTRNGMTDAQKQAFLSLLHELKPTTLMHGACRGADEDACEIARNHVEVLDAHPGVSAHGGTNRDRSERAMDLSDVTDEPKTHFARNRVIVEGCDLLVACPPAKPLPSTGGTSYTVGYAEKVGRHTVILYPDGEVERR